MMKVILVNGSPHEKGCTYTALCEVERALNGCGVDTEMFWLGNKPVSGCLGCGACAKTGRCFMHDRVNEFLDESEKADGFIFGSAVHYAAATGAITSFMDRVFFGKSALFALKPAACVVSCRRGGASAAFDQLNKYFSISGMPIATSVYWNQVHGNTPEEVLRDGEGMQTMRMLGKNMAWLLKCIEAGRNAGVPLPEKEKRVVTNFIR